jgi:hypothetical protein
MRTMRLRKRIFRIHAVVDFEQVLEWMITREKRDSGRKEKEQRPAAILECNVLWLRQRLLALTSAMVDRRLAP